MGKRTALYRLFDDSERLLYVGVTKGLRARVGQHENQQPWWNAVTTIKIQRFATRGEALAAERRAIRREAPVYNFVFRPASPTGENGMPHLTIVAQTSPPTVQDEEEWRGLPPAILRSGGVPFFEITYSGETHVSGEPARHLRVTAGTAAFERDRVQGDERSGGRVPYQLATSWYTMATLAAVPEIRDAPDVDPPPLRRRMLDAGRNIHYEHTVGSRDGTMAEYDALKLPPHGSAA